MNQEFLKEAVGYLKLNDVENILEEAKKISEVISKAEKKDLDDIDRCLSVLLRLTKLRIKKEYGIKLDETNAYNTFKKLGLNDENGVVYHRHFLDHCSKETYEKKTALISEPYDLSLEDLKELIKYCEDNNLTATLDGKSSYFPGRTLRLKLMKKEEKKE